MATQAERTAALETHYEHVDKTLTAMSGTLEAVRTEVAEFRVNMRDEIADVRTMVHKEIADVRSHLDDRLDRIQKAIADDRAQDMLAGHGLLDDGSEKRLTRSVPESRTTSSSVAHPMSCPARTCGTRSPVIRGWGWGANHRWAFNPHPGPTHRVARALLEDGVRTLDNTGDLPNPLRIG